MLYSISKVEVFDLQKKEIVATICIRNADYTSVMYKNFAVNLAENNCVIDLDKLKIVKKFNAYEIIKKYLLAPKHKSEKFHVEEFGSGTIEITDDKLLYIAKYHLTDFGQTNMWENYSHICEFDIASWKLLKHYSIPNNYMHETVETKLSFLNDDTATIGALIKKILQENSNKYDQVLFYNTVYNVVCYRVDNVYYIKYLDDLDSNERNLAECKEYDDLLVKSVEQGFDVQDYIRKNGLSKAVLDTFSESEILDGGYFWALDKIDTMAKQFGQGITKYLESNALPLVENILYSIGLLEMQIENDGFFNFITGGSISEFNSVIDALNLVGAKKTAKALEKGKKLMIVFNNLEEKPLAVYRTFEEESIKIEDAFADEDFATMTINYLKLKL